MKVKTRTHNFRPVFCCVTFFLNKEERELVERAIVLSPKEVSGERKFATFVKKAFIKVASTVIDMNDKEKEFINTFSKTGKNRRGSGRSRKKVISPTQKEEHETVRTVWMRIDRNTLDFLRTNFDLPALFKTCYLLAAKKLIKHFTSDSN